MLASPMSATSLLGCRHGPRPLHDATNRPAPASKGHEADELPGHGQGAPPAIASDGHVPRLRDVLRDRDRSVPGLWQQHLGLSGSLSLET